MSEEQMRAEALQRMVVDALHLPPELAALVTPAPGETSGDGLRASGVGASPTFLDDIVDELTVKYLRPILRAHGVDDPEAYRLGWEEENR